MPHGCHGCKSRASGEQVAAWERITLRDRTSIDRQLGKVTATEKVRVALMVDESSCVAEKLISSDATPDRSRIERFLRNINNLYTERCKFSSDCICIRSRSVLMLAAMDLVPNLNHRFVQASRISRSRWWR